MQRDEFDDYIVPVEGHSKPLTFSPNASRCGQIRDGVSFRFGQEGCWVIDLATLREMVALAEEWRAVASAAGAVSEGQAMPDGTTIKQAG